MTWDDIKSQLLESGLHEESVDRMLRHYKAMHNRLREREYDEVGVHVGKFCESTGNIVLHEMGEGIEAKPQLGMIVNKIESAQNSSDVDDMLRLVIPRFLRAAYDLRSKRDSVHINLKIPVNYADQRTSVRMCTWILTELIRQYGERDNMDEIAKLIDELSTPISPYVDSFNGERLLMATGLKTSEEIIVHLYLDGSEVNIEKLYDWLPSPNIGAVHSALGSLADKRQVHWDKDEGIVKITYLGQQRAESVLENKID